MSFESEHTPGVSRLVWVARAALVAGYLGFIVLGFTSPLMPRIFWTMLLPLIPVAIVLMGFPVWRRICPLAFFGEGGRRLERKVQRRVPAWLERWFLPASLLVLLAMLVLRLVATNGDGLWLSGLLIGLALAAFAVNRVFTGKTWCNFVCPVGVVERIYTEPNSLVRNGNSQCPQCTACKKHCPDIDQENSYWKGLKGSGRRLAFFAFPGLVLSFYVYYWLRAGDWEAYFDGRWTKLEVTRDLWLGPGFFFAPQVPAVVAATLTLVLFSLASYAVFLGIEWSIGLKMEDADRRRHLTLTLAAFTAFNLFYLFAGAPTLRRLPGGTRSVAFVAPLVATLFLVSRWRRTQVHFIGDRSAARLLRSWPFDEPPPNDPAEVYGWVRASKHARDKDLEAYANIVREMIRDGLVQPQEMRLLEGVRERLGISENDHENVLARLTEEERHLFEEGASGSIEQRAQLEGYRTAVAEALLRGAGEEELLELQERFGVDEEAQSQVLATVRGASGELFARAERQLERARALQDRLRAMGGTEPTPARLYLYHLLKHLRDLSVERVLDSLEAAGDAPLIQPLRRRVRGADKERRKTALELLVLACPGSDAVVAALGELIGDEGSQGSEAPTEAAALSALLSDASPYLRAGAAWAAADIEASERAGLEEKLAAARRDAHPLVREAARSFPGAEQEAGERSGTCALTQIEIMSFLATVPFFAKLEPSDAYDLSFLAVEETVAAGKVVCEEGDTEPDALFVILSGTAVVSRSASEPGEGPREEEVLRRGGTIGDLSVFDGQPREATVRAGDEPLRLLRIQGQSLRSALQRRPEVTTALLSTLAARVRRLLHRSETH